MFRQYFLGLFFAVFAPVFAQADNIAFHFINIDVTILGLSPGEQATIYDPWVAEIPFSQEEQGGGNEESRLTGYLAIALNSQTVRLKIPDYKLVGKNQISFKVNLACGSVIIETDPELGGAFPSSVTTTVVKGDCKTVNIPPIPGLSAGTVVHSSSFQTGSGYGRNAQRDAAARSLLEQLGVDTSNICTAPCPAGLSCLASNITSSTTDGVDKVEEDEPNPPTVGEKRWSVTVLDPSKGWDGQIYCTCVDPNN